MPMSDCQVWLKQLLEARPVQAKDRSGSVSCILKINEDGSSVLEVALNHMILPTEYYIQVIHFLNTATEKDTVVLYIDNQGGSLFAGISIAEAFKRTKAKVITHAITIAASSAALIFTNGHEKHCAPTGHLMYHTASYLTIGKTQQHEQQCLYIKELVRKIMAETKAVGLINDTEEQDINRKGSDIFIPGSVVRQRLNEDRAYVVPKGGSDGV